MSRIRSVSIDKAESEEDEEEELKKEEDDLPARVTQHLYVIQEETFILGKRQKQRPRSFFCFVCYLERADFAGLKRK